jgi:uncharacterized membrane protein
MSSSIVEGLASFDRVYVTIGGLFGILICLVFIGLGIWLLTNRKNYIDVSGTVVSAVCSNNQCTIKVSYSVNNKAYNSAIQANISDSNQYVNGVNKVFPFVYDKRNESNIYLPSQNSLILPVSFIVISTIVILFIFLGIYLSYSNKYYAAAQGTGILLSPIFGRRY